MTFRWVAALSAVALTALSGTAQGAIPDSQRAAYDLGRCIVRSERGAAARLIATLPTAGETTLAATTLGAAAPCAGVGTAVSVTALRGGIAQELYLRDFREFGIEPGRYTTFAELALPTADGAAADARTVALYRLGECVARSSPQTIDRLMRAPLGSTMERNILASLGGELAACTPTGTQAALRRDELRSVLAQSAYSAATRYWRGQTTIYALAKN